MTSLIKGHLTFSELLERWQINKTDLFHLIADKKLFPSIFLNGFYDVFESGDQGRGWKLIAKEHDYMKWVVQQIESEFDDNFRATEVNGYYYLRFQRQAPFELEAYQVRDKRPSAEWGGRMWRLDEAVQFNCGDDHIGDSDYVVFLREEIERCELEEIVSLVGSDKSNFDQKICIELADTKLRERLHHTERLLQNTRNEIEELKSLLANPSLASLIPDDHPMSPPELIAALKTWMKAKEDSASFKNGKAVKKNLRDILDSFPEYDEYEEATKERICTVANWNKGGGAPPVISNCSTKLSE